MTIDFAAEVASNPPAITNEHLAMITALAEKQIMIEDWIKKREDELKVAKEELRKVSEVAIPNAMAEVGMTEFKLVDGSKITIKQEIYASIPADNKEPAFNWLRRTGNEGLIKNVISCQFGKGEDAEAMAAAQALVELGLRPEQQQTVHPMTLKAFLKEQMEKGVDVPLTDFGAYTFNKTKIVRGS